MKLSIVKSFVAALTVSVLSFSSHAALDAAVSDFFTNLTAGVADYYGPAFLLLGAVLTLFIGIKWVRRVATRAS